MIALEDWLESVVFLLGLSVDNKPGSLWTLCHLAWELGRCRKETLNIPFGFRCTYINVKSN